MNRWDENRSGIRFAPSHLRTLAPAGHLDIDSTGLLVLTQDGRIAKQLIGGHSEVDKKYLVRVRYGEHTVDVDRHLPAEKLALLRHGLELDGVPPLKTAQVSWQNGEQLRFVLREGKKRQIRRMCELVGLEVVGAEAWGASRSARCRKDNGVIWDRTSSSDRLERSIARVAHLRRRARKNGAIALRIAPFFVRPAWTQSCRCVGASSTMS